MGSRRFLLHLEDGLREAVETDDIYYLEAREGDTLVRLRGKTPKIDRRRFEVVTPIEPLSVRRAAGKRSLGSISFPPRVRHGEDVVDLLVEDRSRR